MSGVLFEWQRKVLRVLEPPVVWDCSQAVITATLALRAGRYELHHLNTVAGAVSVQHGAIRMAQLWAAGETAALRAPPWSAVAP